MNTDNRQSNKVDFQFVNVNKVHIVYLDGGDRSTSKIISEQSNIRPNISVRYMEV